MADSVQLKKVPETLLKKRKRIEEIKAKAVAGELNAKKTSRNSIKRIPFKRAEKFIKEFRIKERYEIKQRRESKKPASCKMSPPTEPRLVLIIRIKSPLTTHDKPRGILKALRLITPNTGMFLKLNKSTFEQLQHVEPYVTWGVGCLMAGGLLMCRYPSLQTVRDLLYKRGKARVGGKSVALTDNALIEKALGEYNIICLEDLVHEITSLGEHFSNVSSLLSVFKLNAPFNGWKKSSVAFEKGGDCGFRDDKINALIKKMN